MPCFGPKRGRGCREERRGGSNFDFPASRKEETRRAPARARPPSHRHHAPELPLRLRLSRPHPRVQRGRGLPQAAASASSPRGSWCLPGPTGLTRTTQPQDVRSDGTTASCHAPPLPPPPASSPPRISPPTPPSRARHESKGERGRFAPRVLGRATVSRTRTSEMNIFRINKLQGPSSTKPKF
ncbi:serine/arginine repetitive matrix protein 1-like [Balaenoptera acutorostrata]|uniref:Serine/arginine repetitive matrix protein 1-like n=1 Tax=Balaenoptera acutorostrata TaxID=9767 RepID=A0ABM3TM28_BALAC|nr:serine/arginine repetitive matrix protein 1-like [Balaenoptera acutorostrata]